MTNDKNPVHFLLQCAVGVVDGNEAMKFTQAALNAANALAAAQHLKPTVSLDSNDRVHVSHSRMDLSDRR